MNALERAIAAVALEETDQVCCMPQVFGHAAVVSGVALGDYIRDGELIARCQIHALEKYGYDCVYALADVNVESEAAGSTLDYAEHEYATICQHVARAGVDRSTLKVPNPLTDGRMPEVLKAARILRKEVGDETMVAGCVLGPLTIASQLMGIENMLYLAVDDPDGFDELMDFATETCIAFGTAQIEAGVHAPIVFNPACSPAVVPPAFFREIEMPRLQQVYSAFKSAGSLVNWLAVAEPTAPNLPAYVQAGVELACVDYYVTPQDALEGAPETCMGGNVRPMLFETGTPEDIFEKSRELMDAMADRGGFILSSGCEIPPRSPTENVAAMMNAVLA